MKHFLYGAPLALSIPPTESEGGPWTEICYEVELKGYRRADGSYARITADDIASMVANFERYPKAPIVVEHADTRIEAAEVNPDWAEPHGWIVALRQGKRTRTVAGKTVTVATLEGRLDVSPEMRLAIVGDSGGSVGLTGLDTAIAGFFGGVHLALADDLAIARLQGEVRCAVAGTQSPEAGIVRRVFFDGFDALQGTGARVVGLAGQDHLPVRGQQVENKLVVGRFLELELCRHGEHLQGLVKTRPRVVTPGQTPRQGY